MSNVLVIGGAGFVGSNLCKKLIENGLNVYSLDNYSTGTEKNHCDGVVYKKGDAFHINEYSMPMDVNVVFHLGEYSRVEQSVKEPFVAINGICKTLVPVIEYCHRVNAKLIYSASSTRFGDAQSPYSISKAVNAILVKELCSYLGMSFAITYFYNVYGNNEINEGKYATVVAKFLKAKKLGKPVTITKPGTQKRNFTHIDDIVNGLILVSDKGQGDGFGIGSDESYSILELAEMIGLEWSIGDYAKGNRSESKVVTTKTKELGWKPVKSLIEYIGEQNV